MLHKCWYMMKGCLPGQGLGEQEYSKEFVPHSCDLHPFDATGYDKCMANRRLIIIGDSLMRQTFQSLACLLNKVRRKHALSNPFLGCAALVLL